MGRMIDVDKLGLTDFEIVMCSGDYKEALKMLIEKIENAPTVDVVRCKDCKWYKESKYSELRPMRFCYRLRNNDGVRVGYNWDENDFCSYGERKEDAEIH